MNQTDLFNQLTNQQHNHRQDVNQPN